MCSCFVDSGITPLIGVQGHDARDREWLARIRDGDPTALGALIDAHAHGLRATAFLVVRRTDLAEDVVQNTFVSIWERRAVLDITAGVEGYLHKTARNIAIQMMRHERAEQRVCDVVEREYVLRSAINDGVVTLATQEFEVIVYGALDKLQPQVREVFLMRRLHGLSYDDIAQALGVSVSTVRSQMSRAMRQLANALEDWP